MKQEYRFLAKLLALASLSVLVFSLSGWAQQSSATIVGTVTDPSGAAIPNATVTVASVHTRALSESLLRILRGRIPLPRLFQALTT